MLFLSGSEIAKTLVLAGINSITLWDPKNVSLSDSTSALFTRHALGSNRAVNARGMIGLLNPMVSVKSSDNDIVELLKGDLDQLSKDLCKFTAVVLCDYPKQVAIELNSLIRKITPTVVFYYTATLGKLGFGFVDAGVEHKFSVKETVISETNLDDDDDGPDKKRARTDVTIKKEVKKEIMKEKKISYVPLSTAMNVKAGKAGVGLTKRTNPLFVVLHVLFKFYDEKNRYPKNRVDDTADLLRIEKEVLDELGLPEEHFVKQLRGYEYDRFVYGEYSSITTVVGGILGQDLIRCITKHESPIRNFFLFCGQSLRGFTESFGR